MNGAAIVTGGSEGIGRAICETLLADGMTVVSLDLRPPGFAHPNLHARIVDLVDEAATRTAAAWAAQTYRPTTIVHNAGAMLPAMLPDVRRGDLDVLVSLHLGAALALVQASLGAMRGAHFGRVVLVSSRAALGLAMRTSYSATKAAMIGMARTWALELGPDGITVNCIAPGPIGETEMFHDVLPPGDARIASLAQSIPVRRVGTPHDVARAVRFLADPDSGFITGQTLFVCGGSSIGNLAL
jgi:NAD(P)-dependent dehydrogenase (short-subunit alcohol dehydrogenase family)